MIWEYIVRFLVDGAVESIFAVLRDVLKPRSSAGPFGAAPSVALATLGLTIATIGKSYATRECRSMIVGAQAFLLYANPGGHTAHSGFRSENVGIQRDLYFGEPKLQTGAVALLARDCLSFRMKLRSTAEQYTL